MQTNTKTEYVKIGGVAEIIAIYRGRCTRQTAYYYAGTAGFPEPAINVPIRLWESDAVILWARCKFGIKVKSA